MMKRNRKRRRTKLEEWEQKECTLQAESTPMMQVMVEARQNQIKNE